MPTTRSAWKRMRSNEKKRLGNQSAKSRIKTAVKKVREAIANKDNEALKTSLPKAFSELDKASVKGVIHKNTASRKKSRMAKQATSLLKTGQQN